ncbi:hypothetical protein TSMEX_002829 [Taenia solium]|eukprot:TsM_000508700 transcript=TsM_000508700 gene=TsM_000508700
MTGYLDGGRKTMPMEGGIDLNQLKQNNLSKLVAYHAFGDVGDIMQATWEDLVQQALRLLRPEHAADEGACAAVLEVFTLHKGGNVLIYCVVQVSLVVTP